MKPLPPPPCHASRGTDMQDKAKLEEDICIHIFTVSSAMGGVCLTVIGLIRVVITLGKADTVADDLLAVRRHVVSRILSPFLRGVALARPPAHASYRTRSRRDLHCGNGRNGRDLRCYHLCNGHTHSRLTFVFRGAARVVDLLP